MIFLVHTPHPWRGIRQRPHHLLSRFAAAGHSVRWVETRYLRWLLGPRRADFLAMRCEDPQPRLQIRPQTLINGERLFFIRAHNKFHLARRMRGRLPAGATGPRILWLYHPHEAHLARSVPHDLLVYDIMDEFAGFPWSPPRIREEEAELLARADWVFAGTHALYEAREPQARGRIECLTSGVESEHFATPGPRPLAACDPPLAALRARYRHLAGYVGMVDLRMDWPALTAAARALPDWGFVLIGPSTTPQAIPALPNLHWLGPRAYADLPPVYHAFDTALLPFVENALTLAINPTKMLEYSAACRPIVARALPDVLRDYAAGAWLYRTPDEFIAGLRATACDDDARHARLQVAQSWANERSWDAIAAKMLARVEALLTGK